MLDVRSFRGADCDTYHSLVVTEVRESLAVIKKTAQNLGVKKFNLRKPSEQEVRKYCQIQISNIFAALENLNDSEDLNTAWENITENIKTSPKEILVPYELKQHEPKFV